MSAEVSRRTGWKPIPLALKILSVVMVVWALGSAMNLPNLMENGLPVLGIFVFGIGAFLVVLFLDFTGPAIFFYALWNGKPWGVKWAFFYIGLFILNGIVALLTVSDRLGLAQILVPNLVSLLFLAVIFWKRSYFTNAD
ncbi:hypothetical protein ACFFUT_04650 [Pseudohalocynthiibacter aestuariivivens]|uniref:Uncharacterized protein n=1 Tax=Pseudohalocynthiibacter aestuariivivens TaxID=1591409 RepID=A0ABV5JDW5_9RHOB|nr:hypothetical protein [Pseudohalocynthiibacter aestuariivivens]MBS9718980.1 hypothetical protein [Pseudohalocynthiibacter aestuariivivens]